MITIQPIAAHQAEALQQMILHIQREEFGIDITLEDQADLLDPNGFYNRGSGGIWVALDSDTVIGSIALIDIGHEQVALRKMFVAEAYRGRAHGVAQKLLEHVFEHARSSGVKDIYLGTTAAFLAAHRFYEKNGFDLVDEAKLPEAFPRMAVDTRFYRMTV
ncbi:MAG: GNAT family N-acetyltransferase [Alphaproteobacteria bacterium]|nr:GNAT family N-acetyltransferase [Alphaproteobacteria bacterium]